MALQPGDPVERSRQIEQLIRELRGQGIADPRVLHAIRTVPRDRFVPDSQSEHAWANIALPIGAGQTISQPFVVAVMTEALRLRGHERVLEIGTGSGYQAAVLAMLAREVITIERHAVLARGAEAMLADLGITNVEVHVADGTLGWQARAPYGGILVTAAAPRIPGPLLDQLDLEGGRLIVPVGTLNDQQLLLVRRSPQGFEETDLGPVRFVPLVGRAGWGPSQENGDAT